MSFTLVSSRIALTGLGQTLVKPKKIIKYVLSKYGLFSEQTGNVYNRDTFESEEILQLKYFLNCTVPTVLGHISR